MQRLKQKQARKASISTTGFRLSSGRSGIFRKRGGRLKRRWRRGRSKDAVGRGDSDVDDGHKSSALASLTLVRELAHALLRWQVRRSLGLVERTSILRDTTIYLMQQITVELIRDAELGGYTARVPDIPAYGEGETEEEAIADLKQALAGYVEAFGLEKATSRLNPPSSLRQLDLELEDLVRA